MSKKCQTTWDGLPVTPEKPHGSAVIVYRRGGAGQFEVLILHRAHHGADYEGDWAWTPPSGARQPDEEVLVAIRRELHEETGLTGEPELTTLGTEDWFIFVLKVGNDAVIKLDAEHDRYEWVAPAEAIRRCRPEAVSAQLRGLVRFLQMLQEDE